LSKIEKTLKQIAEATQKESSPTSSSPEPAVNRYDLPGDPNCPICKGIGYLRRDLPVGHPDFGKVEVCTCRQAQVSQQIHQRLFSLSNLQELSHLTFENFQPRGYIGLPPNQAGSLEQAFRRAQQFSQNLNGWLLLQGGYGCGKTHLAAAIANFAVSMGVPTLFITVPDMLDSLRFAFNDPDSTFAQRFEEIRSAPLLVLDDFGTQNATEWAKEKLFQIVNYRYTNRLPLVVTTNLNLDDIEERIHSRLLDDKLVDRVYIQAPDYRNPIDDSSLGLLNNLTFATFDLRKEEEIPADVLKKLENAVQSVRAFADDPDGWLLLMGGYGCGKTHLAAAIANHRKALGFPVMFDTVPDLLDHLRAAFSPSSGVSLDRRFEQVRSAPLLILDDLGTQSATPWAREKLYQLFNYRYSTRLPTVITTALRMDDIDERLRSRMMDSRICKIHSLEVPTYTGSTTKQRRAPLVTRKKR
jgi:DNA replication protein DnaC